MLLVHPPSSRNLIPLPLYKLNSSREASGKEPDYQGERRQWEIYWRVSCLSALSLLFALFCTSGAGSLQNYTSQALFPAGFLLSFTSWEALARNWRKQAVILPMF